MSAVSLISTNLIDDAANLLITSDLDVLDQTWVLDHLTSVPPLREA